MHRLLTATFLLLLLRLDGSSENDKHNHTTSALRGYKIHCTDENQMVSVTDIGMHLYKCISCICQNGLVECQIDAHCPPKEGCHWLAERTEDGCCERCKGCNYKNRHYQSRVEWTDPENPCKVLRCEAGIITESDMQCHTPCPNPIPPEPGTCCPTCPECKINGQTATDDRDVISDDPCLKCRCSKGRLICAKQACPVLQCTQTYRYHPPGECCPRCSGTRTIIQSPGSCLIGSSVFRDGQSFNIDRCTSCICKNQTSICQRTACPILDCAPEMQKKVAGNCCKQCMMMAAAETQTKCFHAGVAYEDGQSWNLDACRSCKCHRGMPSCATTKCNLTLPCPPKMQLVHHPDECCGKCVEVDGVCMVFGDPHYKTFDGRIYTFQGLGKYQLVSDCVDHTFAIRVANTRPTKYVRTSSTTKRVSVRYGDLRLNLQQKIRIKLNGQRIRLPYRKDNRLRIEKIATSVRITLQNGVKIFWNGQSFLEVTVPAAYKNKVCGLCGNFNHNVRDDLQTRKGVIVDEMHDMWRFGASWCIGSKSICTKNNKHPTRLSTCSTYTNDKYRCKYLTNSELFIACNSKLHYMNYYKTCKMDMCNCPNGKCYCDSLMAYARECERLGVDVTNWQKHSMCDEGRNRKSMRKEGHTRLPFSKEEIERLKRQKQLNRTIGTRTPLLIN